MDIRQEDGNFKRVRYSTAQRTEVHSLLSTILDRLDELQRPPDPWEETCLVHALHFLEARLYGRACSELESCILPPAKRPSWRAEQANKNPRRYTVARLRMRFEAVKIANK